MKASAEFETYQCIISPYIQKSMCLRFDRFVFPILLTGIDLVKVSKIKPALEKRINSEGKNYTPGAFIIFTDVGELLFFLEDTRIQAVFNGFQLQTDSTQVRITKA